MDNFKVIEPKCGVLTLCLVHRKYVNMNDIGIKIVESPKDRLLGAEVAPAPELGNDHDVDPLSIDEDVKDSLVVSDEKPVKEELLETCDDNAKEESINEPQINNTDNLQASNTDKGIQVPAFVFCFVSFI